MFVWSHLYEIFTIYLIQKLISDIQESESCINKCLAIIYSINELCINSGTNDL